MGAHEMLEQSLTARQSNVLQNDPIRLREVSDCMMRGVLKDATTYDPVGFITSGTFRSLASSVFDCARLCHHMADLSPTGCVQFSYRVERGGCFLHHPGAKPQYAYFAVSGSPTLSR